MTTWLQRSISKIINNLFFRYYYKGICYYTDKDPSKKKDNESDDSLIDD
jgi:hypothetical protein